MGNDETKRNRIALPFDGTRLICAVAVILPVRVNEFSISFRRHLAFLFRVNNRRKTVSCSKTATILLVERLSVRETCYRRRNGMIDKIALARAYRLTRNDGNNIENMILKHFILCTCIRSAHVSEFNIMHNFLCSNRKQVGRICRRTKPPSIVSPSRISSNKSRARIRAHRLADSPTASLLLSRVIYPKFIFAETHTHKQQSATIFVFMVHRALFLPFWRNVRVYSHH